MAKQVAAKKTYVLELKNGNIRKVTVPSHWKLTFGQIVPHSGDRGNTHHMGIALRFYEGTKENLRAVMTDVVAIRDESIEILERRTKVQRKVEHREGKNGMRGVEIEARVSEWINPDKEEDDGEVPADFLNIRPALEDKSDF
jgi:hypothetical protein